MLPFQKAVVGYLTSIVVTCLVITLVAAYLYGALRIRGRGRKMTPALKTQVSVLLGLYLLLKAASYWLSRYSLTTSNRGPVTGLSYTDTHATLPGLTVLVVIAVRRRCCCSRTRGWAGCAGSRWPWAGCSSPPSSSEPSAGTGLPVP